MGLLIGSITLGLILSLLALGVLISFRLFDFPDITTEGSITLGAAVAAVLLVNGLPPPVALAAAFAAGAVAGTITGTLFAKFGVNALLSGILVMTALYSVNLQVMGKSNQPVPPDQTVYQGTEWLGRLVFGSEGPFAVRGWEITLRDASAMLFSFVLIVVTGIALYVFFRTDLGTSMRATGDNRQMIRALGSDDGNMTIVGLALANGLVGLSGAFLAQYQGFADVQMGVGMVVWGLASVIIGEALVGTRQLGYVITGAVMGSVLFRLLVAVALRAGMNPNHLKAITAVFVFCALVLPKLLERMNKPKAQVQSA